MHLTHRHVLAAVTVAFTAACSGNEPTQAPSGPSTSTTLILSLSVRTDTIPEATSKMLTARVTDVTGFMRPAAIQWSSVDPSIATVSNGFVTGVRRGVTSIIASTTGAADTATIVVTENDLTLDVQPSAAAVVMGDTVSFVATLRSRSGDVIHVNSFKWSASDTSAAKFVGNGSLVTKKEGELDVSAEALARQGNSSVKIFRAPVHSVTITPSTANVYKGASLELVVTLRDRNGRLVEGDVSWGSSDFSKATISQDGIVTGVGAGTVVITATAESKTGSATINVLSPPAAEVHVSLPSSTVTVGSEIQATATAYDSTGQELTGKTIGWQSANPSIATVTSTGKVKGVAEGNVAVSAIVDGIVAKQTVAVQGRIATSMTISPSAPAVTVGQQAQLVATVLDQFGVEMTGQSISWSSSVPHVATVSSTGLLQGLSAGGTTINATNGKLSASASASVINVPVASVRVTPSSATLTVGGQTTLVAEALDANQNVLPGRAVSWASQSPTVASISSSGLVSAIGSGSATIVATIEGKSASASVSVNSAPQAPVASVSVAIGLPVLDVGQQTQAVATLKDASGNLLTGRTVTWTSLDTAVAKVSSSGTVTAFAGGTVAILAHSEGVSGSASLTVNTPTAAPVARVRIDVPTQDLTVGQSVQSVVTLYDAAGNVLSGRTMTYGSENSSVITVSASGVVKGVGSGRTRMVVTSEGVTGTEGFDVTSSTSTTVSSVVVSPSSTTLSIGQSTQASAEAKDALGGTVSGATFTWSTTDASVATVSADGFVSAVAAGSATIHASTSGKTGNLAVTVTAPTTDSTVATVSVSVSPNSISVGSTAQATAVPRNAQGSVIPGKSASWSVSHSSLGSVSTSGLVTGAAAGTQTVWANIDGIKGSASLTITDPQTLPPPSTSVELPRTYLNYGFPARTGQTIVVGAGGNLQNALNAAKRGDEIVLAAGATFTGNYTLPAKAGSAANGWITIRSDKLSQLPTMGTRVHATNASLMPKIVTNNTGPAIRLEAGASGWWISGVEVSVTSSVTTQHYGLIFLGESSGLQKTMSSVPQDIVLDRMYIHAQSTTNISRCVALNSGRTQISDSYIVECHGKGFDSQAIGGWNGPGPYKIVNNALQGAGENIMFGGGDPGIPGLVPSDIEIRQNHLYTPVAWKGVWTKKNLFELKNAVRVLVEGNVFDGSWSDGQTGWAVVLKSANQSGGCTWCRTTDVTFRRNLIRNAGAGINVAPRGDNTAVDTTARRIYLGENVLENIGVSPYVGDLRGFQLLKETHYITIERNVLRGSLQAAIMLDKSPGSSNPVFKDNVLERGQYGVIGTGSGSGTASLTSGAPGYTWANMYLIGTASGTYPAGTYWISSESAAPLASQIRSIVSSATSGVPIP